MMICRLMLCNVLPELVSHVIVLNRYQMES